MTARAGEKQRTGAPAAHSSRPLMSLPQIAALAHVRRPVVTMWRSRFSTGTDAFPAAAAVQGGQELFDATAVAAWLAATSHGNNPDAQADAAAFATASDRATDTEAYRAAVEALLALRVSDGAPLTQGNLRPRAHLADPGDRAFQREIDLLEADSPLPAFVEQMIDAAYSPAGAVAALHRQTAAAGGRGAAGSIAKVGTGLVALLARVVSDEEPTMLVDAPGALSCGELLLAASDLVGDGVEVHVPAEARAVRRWLIIHDRSPLLAPEPPAAGVSAVWLARLRGEDTAAELAALEELLVELSDHQRLIVVGSDAALTEPIAGAAGVSREFLLRSGRVRAIVRLPAGLVPSAVRQSLAVWLIGEPQGGAALADRFTVVGDLRGVALSDARTRDLVSDLAASLGSARDALAHAFRFVHFVRTSTLIASGGSLVAASRPQRSSARTAPAELAALVDQKLDELADPSLLPGLRPSGGRPVSDVLLGDALDADEVRVIRGIRLDPADTTAADGFPVIGRDEVLAQAASDRRIDRVRLAMGYPRAQLTLPGDVIVLTGSRPAALVDPDGSSIVEYPARVLRLQSETLAPEVVAADIRAVRDAIPWRRWSLRRVPEGQKATLSTALAGIVAARWDAERKASALAELETLVTDAIAAGALTAEIEPHHPEGSL